MVESPATKTDDKVSHPNGGPMVGRGSYHIGLSWSLLQTEKNARLLEVEDRRLERRNYVSWVGLEACD